MKPSVVALVALALTACTQTPAPPDGGTADAQPRDDASDDATDAADVFVPADHAPTARVPALGGAVLAHPTLVTITFANDPNRADHEAFDRWIVGSAWLARAGGEYGVGAGTTLPPVERADDAPTAVTSPEVEALLVQGLTDGSIPRPTDGLANALYVVYYPPGTTASLIDRGGEVTGCEAIGGFHSMIHRAGLDVAYAVVPMCPPLLPGLTAVEGNEVLAAHEIFEAATDPDFYGAAAYRLPDDTDNPWSGLGGELADLCESVTPAVREAGFVAPRTWSNAAAAADREPCIPSDPTAPCYDVASDPAAIQSVTTGVPFVYAMTAWSSAPVPSWSLSTTTFGAFRPQVHLSTTTVTNGTMFTATVTVPTTAATGDWGTVVITSHAAGGESHRWPLTVAAQ